MWISQIYRCKYLLSSDKPIAAQTINGMQSTAEMMLNVRNALKLKMNDQMINCKMNCRIQIVLTEKLLNTASGSWSNVMFQFWNVLLVFSVLWKKNEWMKKFNLQYYVTSRHQKDISKLTYGNGNYQLSVMPPGPLPTLSSCKEQLTPLTLQFFICWTFLTFWSKIWTIKIKK